MINKNGVHASTVSHDMCSACLMHVNMWTAATIYGRRKPVDGTVPFSVSSRGLIAPTGCVCPSESVQDSHHDLHQYFIRRRKDG